MFNDTIKAFEECEFDFVYNARYSVRAGTIAAKIFPDDISGEKKAERWHKLNDKLLESVEKRNKLMI
jgi:tRNA A37 methylthiotransferase MiaB